MQDTFQELETLLYTEYIDLNNAFKILYNWDRIIYDLPVKRQKKILEKAKNFDPLIQLKKICRDKRDIVHTKYDFSKSLKTYGRLFAQNASLQGLPREIRNALSCGKYYDVDMKNAHPTLLAQYCNKEGIKCEALDEYITNREVILSKICTDNQLSYEDAKNAFLVILNGGEPSIQGQFVEKYKDEVKKIHKQVCLLNSDEFKKVKSRKGFNQEGSMMNIILCKLEHRMLMHSVKYMRSLGFNVDVLIFDGFMVRMEPEKILTSEILDNLNQYVQKTTGYNISFTEKSLDHLVDLTKYPDPLTEKRNEVSYFKDKEEFEKTHLKIIHPPLYITSMDDGTTEYQTEDKLIVSYKQKKTTYEDEKGNIIKGNFIKQWINDEHIKVYRKQVFVPPPTVYDKRDYNTWQDFKQESMSLPSDFNIETNPYIIQYKDFIYNLFNGVQEYIDFYDAWCANIIQNPAKRSTVCLVLYSVAEGVGKNTSTKTLERCIGENYTNYITDVSNQLFGRFSSAELNKLLVVLNEIKGKDTYANADLFKTRITDDKREVELKGKDTIQMTNYCSYILNTNNANSVNAGEKDRRFCVLPCINKKINDKDYFDNYETNINNNPEAIRCIYEYLKRFDIEKVVPGKKFQSARPKSSLYTELQECNREKEWDFLEDIVSEHLGDKELVGEKRLFKEISMNDLWLSYKLFCHNNNYDVSKLPSKRFHFQFSQNIVEVINNKEGYDNSITKGRERTSRLYTLDMTKLGQYFNLKYNFMAE